MKQVIQNLRNNAESYKLSAKQTRDQVSELRDALAEAEARVVKYDGLAAEFASAADRLEVAE